jgi:hypothetical protein
MEKVKLNLLLMYREGTIVGGWRWGSLQKEITLFGRAKQVLAVKMCMGSQIIQLEITVS